MSSANRKGNFLDYISSEEQLEDLESVTTDYNEEMTSRTSHIFRIAEPLTTELDNKHLGEFSGESDEETFSRELSCLMADVEIDVTSEDERQIVNQIKEEIKNKVKGEMKDELDEIEKKRQNINNDALNFQKNDDVDLDPKLHEAILQMKKLDRILDKKIKREKEVKRERIFMQRRLKEELEAFSRDKHDSREITSNIEKFLSLTLPPHHNSGVKLDNVNSTTNSVSESPSLSPVFQTQLPDDINDKMKEKSETNDTNSEKGTINKESVNRSSQNSGSTITNKNRKNFIKRNKELASDAASSIAMTDDEKKRISDLLKDIDQIQENTENSSTLLEETFLTVSVPGEFGFRPDPDDEKRLEFIDSKLKFLLPQDEYDAISSSPSKETDSFKLRVFTKSKRAIIETDEPGEEVLFWQHRSRDDTERLSEIESRLQLLSAVNSDDKNEIPKLSAVQLNELLAECSKSISLNDSTNGDTNQDFDDSLTNVTSPTSSRKPFLPVIDPKGTLSTQKYDSFSPLSSATTRSSANIIF